LVNGKSPEAPRWRLLTPDNVHELTERYQFGDGCVREVRRRQTYGSDAAAATASVAIELIRNRPPRAWTGLHFELSDVRDFRVVDINTESWVLFDDPLVVRDAAGRLHLAFDHAITSAIEPITDMAERSHLYFSAREIRWAEMPLS